VARIVRAPADLHISRRRWVQFIAPAAAQLLCGRRQHGDVFDSKIGRAKLLQQLIINFRAA
jgi:hypothetical protein